MLAEISQLKISLEKQIQSTESNSLAGILVSDTLTAISKVLVSTKLRSRKVGRAAA